MAIEVYLDFIGRPQYSHDGFLRKAGQDLSASGLTEYMWDLVYWTWISTFSALLLGDKAWWLYSVVPVYTLYLIATVLGGLKGYLPASDSCLEATDIGVESKRQQKKERRVQEAM